MLIVISLFLVLLWGNRLVLLVLIGVSAVYFYRMVRTRQSYWEEKGIKHVKPTFLFGTVSLIRSKSWPETVQNIYNQYPKDRYVCLYKFVHPDVMIRDPTLIKAIAVKHFDHFVNHRAAGNAETDPVWSRNLFASRDDSWRDLRTTLSPSFTSSKMKIMFKLIEECAGQFVEYFKQTAFMETAELEMKDTISRYTNDVIASTAFGLKCNSLKDRNNEFYLMGKRASDFGGLTIAKFFVFGFSPTLAWLLNIKIIPTSVANYFTKIIERTVEDRREKRIVRPDMIHLLMAAQHEEEESLHSDERSQQRKHNITLEDITSQAILFFLAGFDTVSTHLAFTFYELAINQDVQERLRREIQAAGDQLSYETLAGLKYLDMVVSEALRKWPPFIVTDRQVTKPFTIQPERTEEKAIHLEIGMVCSFPIYAIHRDPDFFPEPEKFNPERFSEENKHKINRAAHLPFGAGPRGCIGSRFALLESKLILFYMLRSFQIVTTAKTRIPMVLDTYQINLNAKDGLWLGLKKFNCNKGNVQ